YPLPITSRPTGIVTGPDRNLWFVESFRSRIGRLDPTTGVITELTTPTPFAGPFDITAAPDQNLWFTEQFVTKVGRVDPASLVITEFDLPRQVGGTSAPGFNQPLSITVGPDNRLWITDNVANNIGAIDLPAPVSTNVAVQVTPPSDAVEDTALTNVAVATFTDPLGPLPASSYQAQIAWGDNQVSGGTVIDNGNGTFLVTGSNTYGEGGTYTLTVTVTVVGSGRPAVAASGRIDVASRPLLATGGLAFGQNASGRVSILEGMPLRASFNPPPASPFVRVASFVDTDPGNQALNTYTVRIEWGDGTTSASSSPNPDVIIQGLGQGVYDVLADHTYAEGGSYVYRVFVTEPGGNVATASGTALVGSYPLMAISVPPRSLVEDVSFLGELVARFTDADPSPPAGTSYAATIDWGDGTSSPGTVRQALGGSFEVFGTHDFTFRAQPYDVRVTVREPGGNLATSAVSVSVADAPLTLTGVAIAAVEGVPFEGPVATLIDANARDRADQFTASIDWGDGTPPSAGTVQAVRPGEFRIIGRHAYASASLAPRSVTVVVAGVEPGSNSARTTAAATVTDSPLTARGVTVNGRAGTFSGTVANFTDANPLGRADQFSATIDWGDGVVTPGDVSATNPDGSGPFRVTGTHTYRAGTYTVLVTVRSAGGSSSVARATAAIAAVPVTAQGRSFPATATLPTGPLVVATFRDADPTTAPADFTAAIDWGDGTTSAGAVVVNPEGGLAVRGDHTYARPGTFPVAVTIQGPGGAATTATGAATVAVRIVPLTGRLAPQDDSGSSNSDGVTRQTRPRFVGTAGPGSAVTVLARRSDQVAPTPLGTTTTDASGSWNLTGGPLPAGVYDVSATSADVAGNPNSPPTALGTLVVDTLGPVITAITFEPRRGRVLIAFRDDVAGLDTRGLQAGVNFTLAGMDRRGRTQSGRPATGVRLLDARTVAVSFNNGRRLRSGTYVLTVGPQGLADLAGNAPDASALAALPQVTVPPAGGLTAVVAPVGARSASPLVPGPLSGAAEAYRRFIRSRLRRTR
ncbi:MAG TPA: Ig-like domain-containing protein, partial [Isosphaeraceae bacterium]